MRIIKITKVFSSSSKEFYLVVHDDNSTKEEDQFLVEEWCENDPAGLNNGYDFEFTTITDKKIINGVLLNKSEILAKKIEILQDEKNEIVNAIINL